MKYTTKSTVLLRKTSNSLQPKMTPTSKRGAFFLADQSANRNTKKQPTKFKPHNFSSSSLKMISSTS